MGRAGRTVCGPAQQAGHPPDPAHCDVAPPRAGTRGWTHRVRVGTGDLYMAAQPEFGHRSVTGVDETLQRTARTAAPIPARWRRSGTRERARRWRARRRTSPRLSIWAGGAGAACRRVGGVARRAFDEIFCQLLLPRNIYVKIFSFAKTWKMTWLILHWLAMTAIDQVHNVCSVQQ